MPRKQKLSIEEKVELVRQCINGKISISGAAQQAGVAPKSVRRWIIAYESEGAEAFLPHNQNRVYSPELKTKAVQDYLLREVLSVYRQQGVNISDKHIEIIVKQISAESCLATW